MQCDLIIERDQSEGLAAPNWLPVLDGRLFPAEVRKLEGRGLASSQLHLTGATHSIEMAYQPWIRAHLYRGRIGEQVVTFDCVTGDAASGLRIFCCGEGLSGTA